MQWEVGVSRCKLLYIGWIKNKVLPYSTGNYIQHPMINHNGKEYTYKIRMYIYVQLKKICSLFERYLSPIFSIQFYNSIVFCNDQLWCVQKYVVAHVC